MKKGMVVTATAALLISILVLGAVFVLRTPSIAVGEPVGEEVLPDLVGMAATDLAVGIDDAGRPSLFFTAEIANHGTGNFIISAVRPIIGDWAVKQRIEHSDQGETVHDTPASLVWGGDGHDHWHVVEAARYRLQSEIDGQTITLHDSKAGFCFWDSVVALPDLDQRPASSVWFPHECGTEDDRRIDTGLSPGWGDRYLWTLPGQSISILDMPPGTYRLTVEADPERWFVESDTSNNATTIQFELIGTEAGITDVGLQTIVDS